MLTLTLITDMPPLGCVLLVGVAWAVLAPYLISAAGMGASAISSSIQANRDRETAANNANSNRQLTESQFNRDLAFRESQSNPFRQQGYQANSLAHLETLAQLGQRGNIDISHIPYANQSMMGGMPRLTPQTLAALGALKESVMAGRTAPDYSREANRGRSSVLDLNGVAAGTLDPSTDAAFSTGLPQRPGATWLDPTGQRTDGLNPNGTGRFAVPRENSLLMNGDPLKPGQNRNLRRAPTGASQTRGPVR